MWIIYPVPIGQNRIRPRQFKIQKKESALKSVLPAFQIDRRGRFGMSMDLNRLNGAMAMRGYRQPKMGNPPL